MNHTFMPAILFATNHAVGKLNKNPATTEPMIKALLSLPVTTQIIINMPMLTVEAMAKMALNNAKFILIPQ